MEPDNRESSRSGQAEAGVSKKPPLSEDQVLLIKYLASEHTAKEIAEKMNKPESWVQNNTWQIAMRFNRRGRVGIVIEGIKRHYLNLRKI